MSKRLYFEATDSVMAYDLAYHREAMEMDGEEERVLHLARPVKIEGMLWCRWYGDSMEKGDCGTHCKHYDPRNGKSGMCKLQGQFYEPDVTVTKIIRP